MRLKVGEKVKIRGDLTDGFYDYVYATYEMVKYAGEIEVVININDNNT